MQTSPCNWEVSYDSVACAETLENVEDEVRERFENMATSLLWNWTGRVFGVCDEIIRPCYVPQGYRPSTFEGMGPHSVVGRFGWLPVYIDGGWSEVQCGICLTAACACEPSARVSIHLPGPAVEITEILIDGEILSSSAYRLDRGRWLIRTDGEAWPHAQDLVKNTSEAGTWSVEYQRGIPVPIGGQSAAGTLACELYRAAQSDPNCGLPMRLQTATREGVSIAVLDSFEDLKDGKTGLWIVDSWVASVNSPRPYVGVASPDTRGRAPWRTSTR